MPGRRISGFLQEDPIGFFGGINRYAYVVSSLVLYADPNGLYASSAHVCCKNQQLSICWDRNVQNPILRSCVQEHERDHFDYITPRTPHDPGECPSPCKGRPDGARGFPLTSGSKAEQECSGLAVEYKCIKRHMPEASDPRPLSNEPHERPDHNGKKRRL